MANTRPQRRATPSPEISKTPTVVESAVAEKPKSEPIPQPKKPSMDFMSRPSWAFELTGDKPVMRVLRSKEISALHPKTNRYEPIRLCSNERSIWISEQTKEAQKTYIIFEDGLIEVNSHETATLEYLFAHPDYGKEFKLVDRAADARDSVNRKKLKLDALKKVFETPIDELRPIALVLDGNDEASEDEIREYLSSYVESSSPDHGPAKFLDQFDNELVQMQALVRNAHRNGILSFDDPDFIKWAAEGVRLSGIGVPAGMQHDKVLAQYLVQKSERALAIQTRLEAELGIER